MRVFDAFSLLEQVLDDPASAGFIDVTTPCLVTPAVATGCQGFFFFDGVHPTTATHARLGAALAAAVPVPAPLVLLLAGLTALAAVRRRSVAP